GRASETVDNQRAIDARDLDAACQVSKENPGLHSGVVAEVAAPQDLPRTEIESNDQVPDGQDDDLINGVIPAQGTHWVVQCETGRQARIRERYAPQLRLRLTLEDTQPTGRRVKGEA